MATRAKRKKLEKLQAEVARIESEPSFDLDGAEARPAPPEPEPLPGELPPEVGQFDADPALRDPAHQPFGAWLLQQGGRKDWIADLAKWAKSDARFPKHGTPDDVRKRLTEVHAEGDAFEALDDAELDWECY